MSHFLFVAGPLRERDSAKSAEIQLAYEVWGLRTQLMKDNISRYLTDRSCGLAYVLKSGICAQFTITSGVQPFDQLDEFVRDDLQTEARYGFLRIRAERRWNSSSSESLALLHTVLDVPDQGELHRRLNLGMHRLTEEQYQAIIKGLGDAEF